MKLKKIKPIFNRIVVTAERYMNSQKIAGTDLIDASKSEGSLKEYQRVVAVGDTVRSVKEGDLVCIDPTRYAVRKHQEGSIKNGIISDNPVTRYNFEMVVLDGKDHILLYDSDISYIIEDYEE